MRIPIGTTGTTGIACALAAALLTAGCARGGADATSASAEVVLQPVAAQGPDPFTDSTAMGPADQAERSGPPTPQAASLPRSGLRALSGATPGLYGGTVRLGSCDVEQQIRHLTADPAKGSAFADAADVTRAAVPGYLRALTPVVLRADTRVTNHGYRDGRATAFPSVLQAGTAVLVDDRGVPRVRCACGNPLKPPAASHGDAGMAGTAGTAGHSWSGYRPADVIEVTPAPQTVTSLTIIDTTNDTWFQRPVGHDAGHDLVVAPPASQARPPGAQKPAPHPTHPATTTPGRSPSPTKTHPAAPASPGNGTAAPGRNTASAVPRDPSPLPSPLDPQRPADGQRPPDLSPGRQSPPDGSTLTDPNLTDPNLTDPSLTDPSLTDPSLTDPQVVPDATEEIAPETAPDTLGTDDGGGPVPEEAMTVFDSPTDVLAG